MNEEQFIHTVAGQLNVDAEAAKRITTAVFRELHDRLTPKEAADAAAQMPIGLGSLWMASEFPGREVKRIHKTEFIRQVSELAGISEAQALHALAKHPHPNQRAL